MPRNPCSELSKTITELAMAIGERPDVKNLDDVLTQIQKQIPALGRAELVASINEATSGYARAKDELKQKLADLRREARNDKAAREAAIELKRRLLAKEGPPSPKPKRPAPEAIRKLREARDRVRGELDKIASTPAERARIMARIAELDGHIAAGTVPAPRQRPAAPADIAALRKQRDAKLREAKRADPAKRQEIREEITALQKHIKDGTRPATQANADATPADLKALREERDTLKRRMDQEDAARARIAKLERHLQDGTLPTPDASPAAPVDPVVAELRAKADALQKALRNSDPALRAKYEKQIDNLTERLELGVQTSASESEPELSKEIQALVYRRDVLRREVRRQIAALRPKTWFQKTTSPVVNTLNAARAVMTSMDFSGVLRQGGFVALGNPARAAKALSPMFRAFASKEASHAINTALLDPDKNPNAPLYARAKLYIAPDESTSGSLSGQEEAFMSRLIGKIPLVAGSQRAYVTFLNVLRAQTFDALTATLARNGEVTTEEAQAIANYVNAATGRGGLGKMEGAATALNTVFFAPRYVASRFQVLTGQPIWGGNARTRKLIAGEYGKAVAGLGLVFALGALAGAEFEDDPTSADFLKLKFGNTRIDPMMGLAQVTTLLSRSAKGIYSTITGTDPEGFRNGTVAGRFLRSKLAPVPSALVNLTEGKNIVGEDVTPGTEAARLVVPMSFGEIADVMEEQGIARGTAFALLNMFGMGVQHYERKGGASDDDTAPVYIPYVRVGQASGSRSRSLPMDSAGSMGPR